MILEQKEKVRKHPAYIIELEYIPPYSQWTEDRLGIWDLIDLLNLSFNPDSLRGCCSE